MSDYRLSVRAIVIKDDKILLNEFNHGEYYNIPGGGLEIGETLKECVKREVYEESGYTVHVKEMVYIYEYNPIRDGHRYGKRGALSHVFKCEIDMNSEIHKRSVIDSDPTGQSISTGCKWIPIDDLNHINLVPKINEIILESFNNNDWSTQFLENIH